MSAMLRDEEREQAGFPVTAVAIATAAVVILVAVLLMLGHRAKVAPNTELPLAGYAAQLPIDGVQMSESTSLSGGKSTYIDGRVTNTGTQTVTGATVQVVFKNEEAMPPQIETGPLTLIRMREPYVDVGTVAGDPIGPGQSKDFRLIFEDIHTNWNQQLPEIRVVGVVAK